jgi:hypothetical protein
VWCEPCGRRVSPIYHRCKGVKAKISELPPVSDKPTVPIAFELKLVDKRVDKRVDKPPVSTKSASTKPVDKVERRKAQQRAWVAKQRAKAKERDV